MLAVKNRRKWIAAGVILAAAASGYLVSGYRSVSTVLHDAQASVDAQGKIRFESLNLDRHAPAGFSWVGGAASGYLDAMLFQDHLFLLRSSELAEYNDPLHANVNLRLTWVKKLAMRGNIWARSAPKSILFRSIVVMNLL